MRILPLTPLTALNSIDAGFVTRTVWNWLVRSSAYSLILLSTYAMLSLLVPSQSELLQRIGMSVDTLTSIRVALLTWLNEDYLLMLSLYPAMMLLARSFTIGDRDPSPPELAVMRRLGARGWVVEACADEGYILYGPAGERKHLTFPDMARFADEQEGEDDR